MFNNRQNKLILNNGRAHWISRSVVVVCLVVWKSKFLIVRRGDEVTQSGKWCVPCGYLDYDETIEECAVREIHEESGIDIRNYINLDNLTYTVNSHPSHTRNQDVGFHFVIKLNSPTEPNIDMGVVDPGETTDAKWIEASEVQNYNFAFNHDKKILGYVG